MEYTNEIKEYMKTLPKPLQTAIIGANAPVNSVEQLKALADAYKGQ